MKLFNSSKNINMCEYFVAANLENTFQYDCAKMFSTSQNQYITVNEKFLLKLYKIFLAFLH